VAPEKLNTIFKSSNEKKEQNTADVARNIS
jgi:hypothetical protein